MRICKLGLMILLLTGHWQQIIADRDTPLPQGLSRQELHPIGKLGKHGFQEMMPKETGIHFSNQLTRDRAAENQIRTNGAGVAAGDYDGDGRCDLYFCNQQGPNALFRNLGNWKFKEITDQPVLLDEDRESLGAVFADVDGDRDLDLLLTYLGGGTRLLLNSGSGRYALSESSGLQQHYCNTSLALGDVDHDGDLDLYAANNRTTTIRSTGLKMLSINGRRILLPEDRDNYQITEEGIVLEYGEPDFLYLNDGKGHFLPMSWTDGFFKNKRGESLGKAPQGWGLSVQFHDMNDDGFLDLYVCNDFWTEDNIWINQEGKGFQAIDPFRIRHMPTFSMAVDFADINQDGYFDFLVADMLGKDHATRMMQLAARTPYSSDPADYLHQSQIERNVLHLNRGNFSYVDIGPYSGLAATGWTWSVVFLDVDLDGLPDVLTTTGHIFDSQNLDISREISTMRKRPGDPSYRKTLKYPIMPQPNGAYRNSGNLTFEEMSSEWGFDHDGVSHGMALADLDNDGDLDVAVNHLGENAGIYQNISSASRIAVQLIGKSPNTAAIGARVRLMNGELVQVQEWKGGGRYLSCDQVLNTFAVRYPEMPSELEVRWPNGNVSLYFDLVPNSLYRIREPETSLTNPLVEESFVQSVPHHAIFEEVSHLLNDHQSEVEFNDFEAQPLLLKKLSREGSGLSWIDLNGDGWDDLIVPGSRGGKLKVFQNNGVKGFSPREGLLMNQFSRRDQTTVLPFYRESGLSALLIGTSHWEDNRRSVRPIRLFDFGKGMVRDIGLSQNDAVGSICMGDLDQDGDLDLFIGGRVRPRDYPHPASSRIYLNQDGRFVPDEKRNGVLSEIGLVSNAVLVDLNQDSFLDLVLACEWGPIRILLNSIDGLVDHTSELGLDDYHGFWSGIACGDFNRDGRLDLVAGNWGLNSTFQKHPSDPLRIYFKDTDESSSLRFCITYLDSSDSVEKPVFDLNSMVRVFPELRLKYKRLDQYGLASAQDIMGDTLQQWSRLQANTFASTVFINRGDSFEAVTLPLPAQWSPVSGVSVADFNNDGHEDIYLAQNDSTLNPKFERQDAGTGVLIVGSGSGEFSSVPFSRSGIQVFGEQRGSAVCDYDRDGRMDLAVSQNAAETMLFHNLIPEQGIRVHLIGPPSNPTGIGSQVRPVYKEGGKGPVKAICAGSGYRSMDSGNLIFGAARKIVSFEIRWFSGVSETQAVSPGDLEIEVRFNRE